MPGVRGASFPLLLVLAIGLAACSGAAEPQSQARASVPVDPGAASAQPSDGQAPSTAAGTSPAETTPPADGPSATTAPNPAAAAIPPKPGNPTWKLARTEPLANGGAKLTYHAGWTSPEGVATSFVIYGVTQCLRDAAKYDKTPCVVKGMKIPKSALTQLAQVSGDQRSTDVAWETGEAGPGPYFAVLIRAVNDAGQSIFTIMWSETVCWGCTY